MSRFIPAISYPAGKSIRAESNCIARYVKVWQDSGSWINCGEWLMEGVSRGEVSAGRVVLPAELREEFGIEDGSEVIFSRTEHGIEIKTLEESHRVLAEFPCEGSPHET
jgi:AbrB family looped-hinge helix DNA binding protein